MKLIEKTNRPEIAEPFISGFLHNVVANVMFGMFVIVIGPSLWLYLQVARVIGIEDPSMFHKNEREVALQKLAGIAGGTLTFLLYYTFFLMISRMF